MKNLFREHPCYCRHFEDKVELIEDEKGRIGNKKDKVELIRYEQVEHHKYGNHKVYEVEVDKLKGNELRRYNRLQSTWMIATTPY